MNSHFVVGKPIFQALESLMLPLSDGEGTVLREVLFIVESEGLYCDLVNIGDVNLSNFDVAGRESFGIVIPLHWATVAQLCHVVAEEQEKRVVSLSQLHHNSTIVVHMMYSLGSLHQDPLLVILS